MSVGAPYRRALGVLTAVGLPLAAILLVGCATTTQTFHWEAARSASAKAAAELSRYRTATIPATDGARHRGRDVLIGNDSLRWTRMPDQAAVVMSLGRVDRFGFVTGRHAGEGALIGGLVGGAGLAALFSGESTRGEFGSVLGVLPGAIIGAYRSDKVIFTRE